MRLVAKKINSAVKKILPIATRCLYLFVAKYTCVEYAVGEPVPAQLAKSSSSWKVRWVRFVIVMIEPLEPVSWIINYRVALATQRGLI